MNLTFAKRVAIAATISVLIVGCAADGSGMTETGRGAAIGTTAGAAAGALIGSFGANAGKGALIGAVGGALIGTAVGKYMEDQRQDFEKALAAEIASGMIRVQKLPNDELLVGMTGETTFAVDSDRINSGFYSTLDKIANIVNKYGKTQLALEGHTDNTGSAQHNQMLSNQRAASVDRYLQGVGVLPQRVSSAGFGMNRPITSNSTEAGRRQNRRVDLIIIPITAG